MEGHIKAEPCRGSSDPKAIHSVIEGLLPSPFPSSQKNSPPQSSFSPLTSPRQKNVNLDSGVNQWPAAPLWPKRGPEKPLWSSLTTGQSRTKSCLAPLNSWLQGPRGQAAAQEQLPTAEGSFFSYSGGGGTGGLHSPFRWSAAEEQRQHPQFSEASLLEIQP